MSVRRIAAGIVLGGLLAVVASTAAEASPPVNTGGSSVVDQANALNASDLSRATAAVQQAGNGTSAHLTVVFVDTFSNPANDQQWATATAQRSGLGSGDLLVAVAVKSHQFGFARSKSFPLDEATVSGLIATDMKPSLAQGMWADATVGFASALKGRLGGSSGASGSAGLNGGTMFVTLFLLVALVVVVLVVVRVLRRRRAAVPAGPSAVGPPITPEEQRELDARASRALIALDDELTTSEQELGFAEAEFGDEAAKPFRVALEGARSRAKEAFGIRQRLDDEIPETPEQRRTMAQRIIQLANEADASLGAQKEAFDGLRKLEAQLPDAVPAADADRARLVARASTAATALEELTHRYGEEATSSTADDLAQARSLLGFAGDALGRAANGPPGTGAVALRGAQQALGQAGTLLDGITAAPADFAAAKRRLEATVTETRSDADEARRLLPRAGEERQALTAAIREADAAVAAVGSTAPNRALPTLERANTALNAILDRVRGQADSERRAISALPRILDGAQRSVDATRRFIDTRRGGVGAEARTRIVEAERRLDTAIAAQRDDPIAALASAQRAQDLADEAYALAQQDIDNFRSRGPFGGGGGGLLGGVGGGFLGGALLGGVLGSALGGGRDWGGDDWGGDISGGGGFDGGGGGFDGGGGGDSGGGGGF